MEIYKVNRDFSSGRYSDSELSIKASNVVEQMTENPHFPTPNPSLETITEVQGAYTDALKKAETGGKKETAFKNECRENLEMVLKLETDYVQQASEGNETIILSSGFDVNRKPSMVGPLAKATGLTIKTGENKGSIQISCNIVEHASFYEFEYTDVPATPASIWLKKTSTKHKLLIDGLTSGKQYVFRVAGAGSDPSRNWSDEISSFVL